MLALPITVTITAVPAASRTASSVKNTVCYDDGDGVKTLERHRA